MNAQIVIEMFKESTKNNSYISKNTPTIRKFLNKNQAKKNRIP